ncbi:YfhO family protein [bacterium]|nr:YfhO family protein [bacterium]
MLLPAVADIFKPGFFPMHDDLQVFRLYEIHKCLLDGQIPCRWVPDAGYGYGYPLMEFYPPMPYYPMELMVLLGAGYFLPVKVMFALAFLLSGLGMYLLAKEFFGRWGGILAGVIYVYSPYHSVDIFVRGAMNEGWGMVWFPFVLLYIYRLITKEKSKTNFILLSLALALQFTSHNVMTLVFAPTAIIWAIFWMWKTGKFMAVKNLFLVGLLGIGLSAFFFIPVVLEQKFVHVDSMTVGYFNYLAHFADIKQLFLSRFWGYGGSTWGPEDGMSFSIGHLQWIGAVLAALIALIRLSFSRKLADGPWRGKSLPMMIIMLVAFGFIYAFLTHSRSNFIWERLSILQFAQFPWRLVALIVFYFSFASGYLVTVSIPKMVRPILFAIFIICIITFNIGFFHFERHVRITTQEKLSSLQWELQVTGGIFDYLPRSAPKPPGDPAFTIPQFLVGRGGILNFLAGSNWMSFDVNSSTPVAKVMLPLYTFPGLTTRVDGAKVSTEIDPELGRVVVTVTQGVHHVESRIGYTTVRLFSDLLTLFSILLLFKLISDDRKHST